MANRRISGIVVAKNLRHLQFHLDLCLQAWARVCDEIIVVTDKRDPSDLKTVLAASKGLGHKVHARIVEAPDSHDVYRFAGYFFCHNPHYVVHFDADYLISPSDAKRLILAIQDAPEDNDIITFRLIYLNYFGTHLFHDEGMRSFVAPFDGFSGVYPFVLNIRRQNFISPIDTYEERFNNRINFESVVNLGKNWGGVYDQKFKRSFTMTPKEMGFSILDSGAEVEHLTWSIGLEALQKKLTHPHWKNRRVSLETVKGGDNIYTKSYSELDILRERVKGQLHTSARPS